MTNSTVTVLAVLLILCVATVSSACNCTEKTPREHVCSAGFAVRARFRWRTSYSLRLTDDPDVPRIPVYIYSVTINDVIKSSPAFDRVEDKSRMVMPIYSNRCGGRTLQESHTYIITGDVTVPAINMQPFLSTNICHFIVDENEDDLVSRLEAEVLVETTDFGCDEHPIKSYTNAVFADEDAHENNRFWNEWMQKMAGP